MSTNKCCGNCKHFNNEDVAGWGWCIIINSFSAIIGKFKPYKWLDKLVDLFYEMERTIFNG